MQHLEKENSYRQEAEKKWGHTDAWQAYWQKEKAGHSFEEGADALMALFTELGGMRHLLPDEESVQEKIRSLQALITENFFPCPNDILLSLGQMYTQDSRMEKNIDQAGGPGTAAFAEKAIRFYCNRP